MSVFLENLLLIKQDGKLVSKAASSLRLRLVLQNLSERDFVVWLEIEIESSFRKKLICGHRLMKTTKTYASELNRDIDTTCSAGLLLPRSAVLP